MFNLNKKCISLIMVITILVMSLPVNASGTSLNGRIVSKEKTEDFYVELFEEEDIYTYYYENFSNKENVVITSSQENGTVAYYNNNDQVYKVKLNDADTRYISDVKSFHSLRNTIIEGGNKNDMQYIDLSSHIKSFNEHDISLYGYTNTMNYFKDFSGREYTDKLISSATIEGYNCQVFESKILELREINRYAALAGDAIGLLLAFLAMPKSVAIAIGIITIIKDGVEVLKYPYTVLKYKGTESFLRDVTVNSRICHEVQRRNVYTIWENDNDYTHEFDFGSEDEYFGNPKKLMEIAVDNYF